MESKIVSLIPADDGSFELIRTIRNEFYGKGVNPVEHFIDFEEHRNWWSALDKKTSRYFLIRSVGSGEILGFVSCVLRDPLNGAGEVGIFVSSINSSLLVPYHSMVLLLEFAFSEMNLKSVCAVFYKGNTRAINFNARFGFKPFSENEKTVTTVLSSVGFRDLDTKFSQVLSRQ